MVIDTSAVLAILQNEPERVDFVAAIDRANQSSMSIVSFVEASFLLESRFGQRGLAELDDFIEQAEITLMPVDVEQARLARRAFSRFGKGRHPAKLNFGDCFSYALAKWLDEPLLFKGNDFSQTDIVAVVRGSSPGLSH